METNISAIKFKLWCKNNKHSAKKIADILQKQRNTIYSYWSGRTFVPDEDKKKLEIELGLPIYEIFFDKELK